MSLPGETTRERLGLSVPHSVTDKVGGESTFERLGLQSPGNVVEGSEREVGGLALDKPEAPALDVEQADDELKPAAKKRGRPRKKPEATEVD